MDSGRQLSTYRLSVGLTVSCYSSLLVPSQQITNFQWLETIHFITLQLWKSEVQNQSRCGKIKVLAGVWLCLLEALEENPFSCLVQLLEASCIPWLVALHHITFSPSVSIFPWPSVSDPPVFLWILMITLGPPR